MLNGKENPMIATIIIPTYNRRELLKITLASLAEQNISLNSFEVIVVDDGSNDDSFGVCLDYCKKLNLLYIYQTDLGFRAGRARNLGIKVASANICIFIDSGIYVGEDFVARHVEMHNRYPSIAVVGEVLGFAREENIDKSIRHAYQELGVSGSIKYLENIAPDVRSEFYLSINYDLMSVPAPWLIFWSGNVSIRKADLIEIGFFDEKIEGWGGEDLDVGYGLQKLGVQFVVGKGIYGVHFPHEKSDSENLKSSLENYKYLAEKHSDKVFLMIEHMDYIQINKSLMSEMVARMALT